MESPDQSPNSRRISFGVMGGVTALEAAVLITFAVIYLLKPALRVLSVLNGM